jgi:hypothetical protein
MSMGPLPTLEASQHQLRPMIWCIRRSCGFADMADMWQNGQNEHRESGWLGAGRSA